MTNISSLPNPSENTIVEITQDGRHAVYLTDEQLILVTVMFGISPRTNNFGVQYSEYGKLINYCENEKLIDNDVVMDVLHDDSTEEDFTTAVEKAVLKYKQFINL